MKGQFYIISAVIIVATLIAVSRYIADYQQVNLQKVGELNELNYISYVRESLSQLPRSSSCNRLSEDTDSEIKDLKNMLAQRGISLSVSYQITSCPTVQFSYIIDSSSFSSNGQFTSV